MDKQSLENCQKTLIKLKKFMDIAVSIQADYTQAACIQAFEFTFEVFWKTFQKIGQSQGVMIGSPKTAFSFAFEAGFIDNEDVWIDLLNDRNMTTHTYHEMLAQQIFTRIKEHYIHAFEKAYVKLQSVD
jgi:nucleotidyltransferase substrate binding protein (TIGR01987 family)